MKDILTISVICAIQVGHTVILQVQQWDINPTTVFGTLVALLATAVTVLWNSNKKKDEHIKELNKILFTEAKRQHDEKN